MKLLRRGGMRIVASGRGFFERIILPQIFLLLVAILFGAARSESPREVGLKLLLICYTLVIGVVVQRMLPNIRLRIAILYVVGFSVLTVTYSAVFVTDPVYSVFAPIAAAILVLMVARLRTSSQLAICAGFILPVLCYATIKTWLTADSLFRMLWLPLGAAAVTIASTLVLSAEEDPSIPDTNLVGPTDERLTLDQREGEQDLLLLAGKTLTRVLVSDYRGVAVLLLLLPIVSTLLGARSLEHSMAAGGMALLCFGGILLTIRLQQPRHAQNVLLVMQTIVVTVAIGLEVVSANSVSYAVVPISVLLCSVISFPWSVAQQLWHAMVSMGFLIAALVSSRVGDQIGWGGSLLLVSVIVLVVLSAGSLRSYVLMRAAIGMLRRVNQTRVDAQAVVRLSGWWARELVGSQSALLIREGSDAEVIRGSSSAASTVLPVFVDGLRTELQSRDGDAGIISARALGEQFVTALVRWFGEEPRELLYGRIMSPRGARGRPWYVVVPLARARLDERRKPVGLIRDLIGLVNALVGAWDVGSRTSDSLRHTEELVARRDRELQDLIHLVNNTAQSVTAICDDLTRQESPELMRAGAHAIVTHTNTLSSVVSDVYLRRELFSGLPGRRPEALPWDSLAANIEGFCRLRLAHRGLRTSVELQTSGIDSVQAASGALLGTAIRWILEQMGGWAQAGGLLSIRSSVHEGKLSLTFEACSVNVRGGGELFATEREEAQLEAFFRAGEGNYEVQPAPNLQTISRRVVLKLRSSAPSATRAPEGWCLFVDDNPQMTTFYARAAEALDIAAHIADTVAAARALILERGEPRLVVTDMQLPDGSGKEVVELIRRSFAKQVPVLVVSGEQLDLVREQLAGLLVWKFLVKPLSRAKLIGALQEVLATQESGVS